MATPTVKERRVFAKSGVAMPDGSFYIRDAGELSDAINAVGRATPNAGESETARRNSVRRHIMRRARALKRTDMIPDTWNLDGSLKHSELEEWLMHHGVKGMHWGVRRKRTSEGGGSGGSGGSGTPTKFTRQDKKYARRALSASTHMAVWNQGAQRMNNVELPKLNSNPKYAGKDLTKNPSLMAAYERDYNAVAYRVLQDVVKNAPASKSGNLKLAIQRTNEPGVFGLSSYAVGAVEARHAAGDTFQFVTEVTRNATGHIISMRIKPVEMKHDDPLEAFLAHYGVLGMKWGVRRRRSASASSSPRSPEAARAARLQTRAQTHGSHSLTNAELQQLVTRMNLENQYGRLNPKHVSTGKKIALGLLVAGGAVGATVAKQTAASFASKYAAQGVEALIKAAAAKKG